MEMHGISRGSAYDPRAASTAAATQAIMAPQYLPSISYSNAPSNAILAHQQVPYAFPAFPASAPTLVSGYQSPGYGQQQSSRSILSSGPERLRDLPYSPSVHPHQVGQRSPDVKHESLSASTCSAVHEESSVKLEHSQDTEAVFTTPVDILVRAVQTSNLVEKPSPRLGKLDKPTVPARPPTKRFHCNRPGCGRGFTQKTHLDIHLRKHTGHKPHKCTFPSCDKSFSQLGNLKTHHRRHTGEKPFACTLCSKSFAQKGNLKAHQSTHLQTKPFCCKLDDCNKQFSQRGNLKSHQNKFHEETMKRLSRKYSSGTITPNELALIEYIGNTYKYSNQGIKGRGKDRKVASTALSNSPSAMAMLPHSMMSLGARLNPHVHSYSHTGYGATIRDRNARDGSDPSSVMGYDMFHEGTQSPSESSTASFYGVETTHDHFTNGGRDIGFHRIY